MPKCIFCRWDCDRLQTQSWTMCCHFHSSNHSHITWESHSWSENSQTNKTAIESSTWVQKDVHISSNWSQKRTYGVVIRCVGCETKWCLQTFLLGKGFKNLPDTSCLWPQMVKPSWLRVNVRYARLISSRSRVCIWKYHCWLGLDVRIPYWIYWHHQPPPAYRQQSEAWNELWIQLSECIMYVCSVWWGPHTRPLCGLLCGSVKSACHQWLNVFFGHFYGAKMFLSSPPTIVPVTEGLTVWYLPEFTWMFTCCF